MKTPFVAMLMALLVGAAMAWIRPAQPVQVDMAPVQIFENALDNPLVPTDLNMKNARKCGFCIGVSREFAVTVALCLNLMSILTIVSSYSEPDRRIALSAASRP